MNQGVIPTPEAYKRIGSAVKSIEGLGVGGMDSRYRVTPWERFVLVKVTGDLAGYGCYTAKILKPPTVGDIDGTSNVDASFFGDDTDAEECILINSAELASSTHRLTSADNSVQFYFWGWIVQINSDGKKVVATNATWYQAC